MLADASDMVSTEGEREYRSVPVIALSGGGKEVCRSGWLEEAEVVESMEAFRRLIAGAEDGISDCRRFED